MNETSRPDDLGEDGAPIERRERSGEPSAVATGGAPVADTVPDQRTRRRRFVPSEEVVQAFAELPPVDVEAWYRDMDRLDGDQLTPDEGVER